MRLIAELTMPRNNSWNGKWSHKENKYTVLFSNSKNMCKYIGNYRHDFVRCSCGAVGIDGGSHYVKLIGNWEDFDIKTIYYRDVGVNG